MILIFCTSTYGMELTRSRFPQASQAFFLWSGHNCREIGLHIALSIPHISNKTGTNCRFDYPGVSEKDLDNFYQYARYRYAIQDPIKATLEGFKSGVAQVDAEQKQFFNKLPVQELSQLTIMAVEMYGEPFPEDLYDPWQNYITREIEQVRGKGPFLENFKEKKEIGEYIYGFCFGAGGYDEKLALLALERGKERQILSTIQDKSDRKREETIDANDDELGWRKFLNQALFVLRQKCVENTIVIGGISLVAVVIVYFYSTRK